MAELLVFTENRGGGRYAGDVVMVRPDGWAWGDAEQGSTAAPFFKVIKCPGAPVAAFADLIDPVTNANGDLVVYRRKHLHPSFVKACAPQVTMLQLNASRRVKVIP